MRKRACPAVFPREFSEQVAGGIYDDMMDFAKYAFNKSHAACLCGGGAADSLFKVLLSRRIYGGTDDLCH